ncbi:MAG: PAS domain S-box protein [Bacillota bacterium]
MVKEKILIVEDEQIIAFVIQRRLLQFGYEVAAIATSGQEAIEKAREVKPDLILMDIHLRDKVDGIQAAREIKQFLDVPVIYLTAFSDSETLERSKLTEPSGFLVKPIDERELYTNVSIALHKNKIDKKLKESEERYNALFSHSPDCVYLIDFKGNVLDANPAALNLFGYSREEALRMGLFDIVAPEDFQRLKIHLEELSRGDIKSGNENFTMQARSGQYIQVEANYTVIYRDEKPYAVQGIARDVTAAKKLLLEVKENERHFRKLYENAPLGYQSLDKNGCILEVNQKWLDSLGYAKAEVAGKWFGNFMTPESAERVKHNFPQFKEKGNISGVELEMIKKNGEHFIASFEGRISYDETGDCIQTHCIMINVTERKNAENALRQAKFDYHALVDSLGGIIWEYDPQAEKYNFVSNKVEDILGYPVDAWMDQAEFWENHIHPDDKVWLKDFLVQKKNDCNSFEVQYRMLHADGSVVWIKDIVSVSCGNEGSTGKIRGIMIDVTKNIKSEEELRKLSTVVEQSPASIIITDIEGNIEYVNPQFTNISGYCIEEAVGKNPRFLKSGKTSQKEYKEMWEQILSGEVWKGEFSNRKKDGTLYWEAAVIAPIKDQKGEITHFAALKEETTGVKIVEKFLIESEDRYRRLVEMSPDMIAIISGGKLVYVNEAAVRHLGAKTIEQLINRDASDFIRHRCTSKLIMNPVNRDSSEIQIPFTEEKLIDLKGNLLDVEIATISTVYRGKPAVQIIARDILQRKKAEQALRLSEERFRTVFENSPIGILITLDQKVHQANEACIKMFGFGSQDEIKGTNIKERVAPECRGSIALSPGIKQSDEILSSGYEITGLRKDGTKFPVHIEVAPLKLKDELAKIVLISDITELKIREEQVKASLTEKEILLKEIHHRVKNNLQIISSLLSLQSEYIEDRKSLALFNDSRNRVKSMALIHERLYQSNDLGRIDFAEYINELSGFLYRTYIQDLKSVDIKIDAESIFLSIELAIPCGLIINELVSNALKYAFPNNHDGTIRIQFRSGSQKELVLIVSDNGVGIPAGINFRETTSLGFQLVNSLVEQMKGRIEINSNSGTEFTIRFPVR